jgi:hypothetical protein
MQRTRADMSLPGKCCSGAGWTQIYGMNDKGQIVGDYTSSADPSHPGAYGFVYANGAFTEINVTNSLYTTIGAIDDAPSSLLTTLSSREPSIGRGLD